MEILHCSCSIAMTIRIVTAMGSISAGVITNITVKQLLMRMELVMAAR